MTDFDREKLCETWQVHQSTDWPDGLGSHEGQLMTLDTVIGGCLTYYFEEHHLDEPRIEILRDCLADLEIIVPELSESTRDYFSRLRFLGMTLLQDFS
ncbi:hypothetical protein [Candidatus Nitrospira neomarina]|uniref:Uncharacterized protein n=1 Tax=Candidatus Nitrospira neomarina TaxID=3020899 RepID=A0AA96GP11_9BACT|nr:hypothetical protein [Candidatus Nitrospira neomarina]WNM61046.1 hypothetical protein PQG83_14960 [Candidatus Nitrospira neomarina]